MKDNIIVTLENKERIVVREGTTIKEFIKTLPAMDEVMVALVNGEICELSQKIKEDCTIEFIDYKQTLGHRVYKSGIKFVYILAIKELFGSTNMVKIEHSLDKGIYTTLNIGQPVTEAIVTKIKKKMQDIIDENLDINKVSTTRKSAIKYFEDNGEFEKVENYKQMNFENISLYEVNGSYNYFYSFMPASTGSLKWFDLTLTPEKGIVLRYPGPGDGKIAKYTHRDKVLSVFQGYNKKIQALNIQYVCDVNRKMSRDEIASFIQINEVIQNDSMNEIAKQVYKNKDKVKMVLIGGPSCSGKTTTSKKLALYLEALGLEPFVISTDDYYMNRVDNPKDENGNYDYECLEALEIDMFNDHLKKLIAGEKIKMPTYNFLTGEKEYKKPEIGLKGNNIIIIEGLHTLNDKLTASIPRSNKYKIYPSPFTPLGLDRHNHISTLDMRLLRRIVRDNTHRGYSADVTIQNWKNVRKGEELYVFPFQNDVDYVYDTASIYEIGVLKTYAEPLLYLVEQDSPSYNEARRLINFLQRFFAIPDKYIPDTSILREFVGVSYFK